MTEARTPTADRASLGCRAALALMLALAATPAPAQERPGGAAPSGPVPGERYAWRHVAIGGGGFITGLDADPTGATRVARTDVYGAYLWLPRENRWAQLVTSATMPEADRVQDGMNEGVYEIVVAPSRPERLYMAIKGRVFRSDDRGAHFATMSRAAPFPVAFDPNSPARHYGPFLAVDPADPDLVLFGTPQAGLLRSADGGATWERVASVPPGTKPGPQAPGVAIWFERGAGGRTTGRILAVSPGRGLFVSEDRGRGFAPLTPAGQPQPMSVKQGAFAPDGAFYAVDPESRSVWVRRANAWTDLTGRPGLGPARYAAVAVNPRNGQIYVLDEGGRARRSEDGGQSFVPLPHRVRVGEGDPPWLRVTNLPYFATSQVVFDPVVPDRLWNAAGAGPFYADLGGGMLQVTWTSQARGIEELVANDVVQPPGQAPLFAAWDFGIHRKPDLDAYSTTYGPKERVLIAAQQLAWSPSNPSFIVTNASDTRTTCCAEDGNAVMAGYSEDAGRTWTKFATLPTPPGTKPEDPWRMAFGTIAVAAGDVNNIVWAPTNNRSPFYTLDRGRTWQRVSLPGERLPFTGSHAHYYLPRRTMTADRVEPHTFYFVHSGEGENRALQGLWRTRDGGANWERVFTGEIAPTSQYAAKLRAVPGHAGHLFFTSAVGGGETRLRRSRDGGATWDIVEGVTRVDDVAFGKAAPGAPYPTIFLSGQVGGRYGVWRSTDDAATWQQVGGFPVGTLDQVGDVGADPDRFGRVYLGYKGSGWIYGEPASCTPAPYRFPADTECSDVR